MSLLTIDNLLTILRSSVYVQDPNKSSEIDPNYLSMTDEDLTLFIKLGVTRAYPDIDDLADLPDGSEFAIVLLAKIELYMKLAVMVSPKVDIGAESAYIKLDQRYQHYMKLAEEAKSQYDDWLENESLGANQVSTYDVLLSDRHYTSRNYEKQPTPTVKIKVESVTADSISISWKVANTSHFGKFVVYISENTIVNPYKDGMYFSDKVDNGATKVKSTGNIRDNHCNINGLSEDTTYHIAVFSVERNQVFGYKEITSTTLEALVVEDE